MRSLSMHHDRVRAIGLDLSLTAIGEAILRAVIAWQDRARERHQLATLDDRLLRDIGLSRCDIAKEVDKPFWQR
ncbi:MAG: DUF1127 domain-containing protein [Alphaproteobacteria bacterium]